MRVPWQAKALVAIVVWGASFIATKTALGEVGSFAIITLRFGMGVVVLLVTVAARGQLRWPSRRELALFALLGFQGVLLHQLLQVTGLRFTSATNTGWMVALIPVFTALLARGFLREHLTAMQTGGIALAFAGALVVLGHGWPRLPPLHAAATWGDFLVFLSAPNWAVFSVLSKPALRSRPAALVMTWVLLLGWLMTLPFFAVTHGWTDLAALSARGWTAILFLGVFCSGAAYIFWYDSLVAADASRVAAFLYLEPLVTVAVAGWLLHEAITAATLAGGAIILIGVWLVQRAAAVPLTGRLRGDAIGRSSVPPGP
jgi:drug/metabolite transporter (DMT)-like permease